MKDFKTFYESRDTSFLGVLLSSVRYPTESTYAASFHISSVPHLKFLQKNTSVIGKPCNIKYYISEIVTVFGDSEDIINKIIAPINVQTLSTLNSEFVKALISEGMYNNIDNTLVNPKNLQTNIYGIALDSEKKLPTGTRGLYLFFPAGVDVTDANAVGSYDMFKTVNNPFDKYHTKKK